MKNLKSRVLSILTILVPILMGLAAVYGLLSGKIDHLIPPVPSDLPVIASTYSVDGDVKHRMAEDTIWLPIQIETKFRNGDFIKTGRDSTVEILLDQKGRAQHRCNCAGILYSNLFGQLQNYD